MHDLSIAPASRQLTSVAWSVPAVITQAGERATRRFIEFFAAEIRNVNTRRAYGRIARHFFRWLEERGLQLTNVTPVVVAGYIEERGRTCSKASVKQTLAGLRVLLDYLVVGHVLEFNPAAAVRGPRLTIRKGKTPVLTAAEARRFLDTIDTTTIAGLRDKALVGTMVFSFARVGAVVGMNVGDYYPGLDGKRWWLRLNEKGGIEHELPAHHNAETWLDAYIHAAGIAEDRSGPLWRPLDRHSRLTARRMHAGDVLRMVKRRARQAGLSDRIGCHTWRATGITAYLQNGGTLENAQRIAAHASARTTSLYDRRSEAISLDEVERIII